MAPPTDQTVVGDDMVELSLPADTRHLRMARLAASGLGADLGLSLDEIEELRLAVGEACALLVDHAADASRLVLRYQTLDHRLVIEGRCPAGSDSAILVDPVAQAVMANTVDAFEVDLDAGHHRFRLVKQGAS